MSVLSEHDAQVAANALAANALAELLADLTWYHARLLVSLGYRPKVFSDYKLLMAACCWDRMGLQLREAQGIREPWE